MRRLFGFHTFGVMLKSLSDSCFEAERQQREGKPITACGMSEDEITDLCENYLPNVLNPMMSTEDVKEKLHISEATLNRKVASGELPNGECKARGHTRYWKSGTYSTTSSQREASDCFSFLLYFRETHYHFLEINLFLPRNIQILSKVCKIGKIFHKYPKI